MTQTDKIIFVYENWHSVNPSLIGRLNTSFIRGQEIFSFEYATEWFKDAVEYMRPAFSIHL